jgi:hypothetical protein
MKKIIILLAMVLMLSGCMMATYGAEGVVLKRAYPECAQCTSLGDQIDCCKVIVAKEGKVRDEAKSIKWLEMGR